MVDNYEPTVGDERSQLTPGGSKSVPVDDRFSVVRTRVNVRSNKFAALEKPLRGITCCVLGRTSPVRKLALHLYYSRLRNLVTIVLIICAGTLVGFVFSEVQTTGDEAGYRNALEQALSQISPLTHLYLPSPYLPNISPPSPTYLRQISSRPWGRTPSTSSPSPSTPSSSSRSSSTSRSTASCAYPYPCP